MSFTEILGRILQSAVNHPLIAVAIAFFVVTTVILGLMHQCEIGGEILILIVKMFKHHARSLRKIGKRLRAQLTTWDDPEDTKEPPASPVAIRKAERPPRDTSAAAS